MLQVIWTSPPIGPEEGPATSPQTEKGSQRVAAEAPSTICDAIPAAENAMCLYYG